jgi:hypothetical protein
MADYFIFLRIKDYGQGPNSSPGTMKTYLEDDQKVNNVAPKSIL